MFENLPTPTLLLDEVRLAVNIRGMQAACDAPGVALWPHVKTHKTVVTARMQLDAGAAGITCAKIGEAEAEQAAQLRTRVAAGETKSALAREFGVSCETLYQYLRYLRAGM
jgi:D-serine deaminase-like pyridoxal phosphate-dependent protein